MRFLVFDFGARRYLAPVGNRLEGSQRLHVISTCAFSAASNHARELETQHRRNPGPRDWHKLDSTGEDAGPCLRVCAAVPARALYCESGTSTCFFCTWCFVPGVRGAYLLELRQYLQDSVQLVLPGTDSRSLSTDTRRYTHTHTHTREREREREIPRDIQVVRRDMRDPTCARAVPKYARSVLRIA
eukprot:97275-Rhodomonas_salina.2